MMSNSEARKAQEEREATAGLDEDLLETEARLRNALRDRGADSPLRLSVALARTVHGWIAKAVAEEREQWARRFSNASRRTQAELEQALAEYRIRALAEAAALTERRRLESPMNGDGSNYRIDLVLKDIIKASDDSELVLTAIKSVQVEREERRLTFQQRIDEENERRREVREDPDRVPYLDIPAEVRDVLDELFMPDGVEIWWNARNNLLFNFLPADHADRALTPLRPRDYPEAAVSYANSLADGNFM